MTTTPTLDIEKVSKTYGDVSALDRMDFQVAAGEVFGFVGSNGAGKTTTMRIAVGVLAADSGRVRWNGRPVAAGPQAGFGYMPEERGLYPKMTVARQLTYLARLHGLSRQEANNSTEYWTERLDVAAHRDRTVDSLSLGNQQRVQLAAALVHHPEVLLLDEPFSGLDPVAVDAMSGALRERSERGAAVLFSSHQLELVERICDRVGVVREGRMVACGTVDELSPRQQSQIYVELTAPEPGWETSAPGVRSARPEGPGIVLSPEEGADDQEILAHAMAHGRVHAFQRRRPSLTDVFRSYVSDSPAAAGSTP